MNISIYMAIFIAQKYFKILINIFILVQKITPNIDSIYIRARTSLPQQLTPGCILVFNTSGPIRTYRGDNSILLATSKVDEALNQGLSTYCSPNVFSDKLPRSANTAPGTHEWIRHKVLNEPLRAGMGGVLHPSLRSVHRSRRWARRDGPLRLLPPPRTSLWRQGVRHGQTAL